MYECCQRMFTPIAQPLRQLGQTELTNTLLERACLAYGLSTLRTSRQSFIAEDSNGHRLPFNKSGTVLSSRPAAPLTMDKHSTRMLLQQAGVPAPKGRLFSQERFAEAAAYAEEIGYPVVVKPLRGTHGRGVVTGISDEDELAWAFKSLAKSHARDDVILEEHIDGEAYRIIVLGDEVVSALISRRGAVTGDGEKTVRELIEERQQQRLLNPHLMARPIRRGSRLTHLLARQDVTLDSVLEAGRTVEITYGSNTSQGGEHAQVMDRMHPSILQASVESVKALPGLGFGGVDFIISDIEKPLDQQRAAICEINSMPSVDSHEYPLYGDPISVPRKMVEASAEAAGISLGEYNSHLSVHVEIDATDRHPRYRRWLRRQAAELGLDCRLRPIGSRRIKADLQGEAESVSAWLALSIHSPYGLDPKKVEVIHA